MNFEGSEKKLEIILYEPSDDLRNNTDQRWTRVVESCGAHILSSVSNARQDAYLLSESSLFIWKNALLLITCGRTTLVNALEKILGIIDKSLIAYVFYERKNFLFPEEQPSDFEEDVAQLSRYLTGKSYRIGPANHDHLHVFYMAGENSVPEPGCTLQILMRNLDPSIVKAFSADSGKTPEQTAVDTGLSKIYSFPLKLDCHQFDPYGYSMHGIRSENYYTVHVTPQPEGSYTSFETSFIESDYSGVIGKIVSVFRPDNFSIVLTTSMEERFLSLHGTVSNLMPGYLMSEKSLYEFDSGYKVSFLNYIRA